MGLEIAKRGLNVHQQALNVTGHNISNADNKHYSRQRVEMGSAIPLYPTGINREHIAGSIGQGVEAKAIIRIRDNFIENRVYSTEQTKGYWSLKQHYFHQIEIMYNEPAEESIRSQLDRFWKSWQELSQYPEELSHREVLKTTSRELTFRFKDTFNKLFNLRKQLDFELSSTIRRINEISNQIGKLNDKIQKHEFLGDNPNDLLDRRDALVQELSSFADITIKKEDPDEILIYLGSEVLIQGSNHHALETVGDPTNEGLSKIFWKKNNQDAIFKSGKMQALLEMRDVTLKENIDKLNLLTVNISDIVNEVHRDGFSLTKETNIDFFELKNLSQDINGNYDSNGDGVNDISAIFRIAGRNPLISNRPLGIDGVLTFYQNNEDNTPVSVPYSQDDTLTQVIEKINYSDAGVVAYLNHNQNLVLKGTLAEDDYKKHFLIRHLEDSGELLVGYAGILQNSGAQGAFDYRRTNEVSRLQSGRERITLTPILNPAGSFALSRNIERNSALIAASQGKDVGGTGDFNVANGNKDGSNALRIAQALRHKKTMVGDFNNSDEFYNALISKLGIESKTAEVEKQNQELILTNLENLRQSIMGVNLDEEMANMIQFQHAYNASARMINVINEMLGRIIDNLL